MIDWPRLPNDNHWVWWVVTFLLLLAVFVTMLLCGDGPSAVCP